MKILIGAPFGWYGFLIGMGMLVCIAAAYLLAKKRGYYADNVFTVAVCCLPFAILGARIYYIIFDIIGGGATFDGWFRQNGGFSLKKFIGFADDGSYDGLAGLAIYGGLIGAMLGAILARYIINRDKNPKNRMSYIQILDAFFVLVILGQAIGRWGNFANDEAYGNVVTNKNLQWFPYAYESADAGAWVQATFFWESMLNLIGFFVLLWLCYGKKRKSYDGFVFSGYCLWYGLVRLIIEGQRSDSLYTSGGFNTFIGIMLIIVSVAVVAYVIVPLILKSRNQLADGADMQGVQRLGYKDLIPHAGLLVFALYCLIRGMIMLFIGHSLRISQFVSEGLIIWGACNIAGHILKAKISGKKVFIACEVSQLSLDYYGYEKTIMFINSAADADESSANAVAANINSAAKNEQKNSAETTDDSNNNEINP